MTRCGTTRARAFTLTELLVVIAIIATLSLVTLVSVRAVVAGARLSSATNTIVATLDNARALALKKNQFVLVVFRPRLEGTSRQFVELVVAEWAGDSMAVETSLIDRFVVATEVAPRALPVGIKVAGPAYGGDSYGPGDVLADLTWETQAQLPAPFEMPGRLIGVMYGPEGTTVSYNLRADSNEAFVDFNGDGQQRLGGVNYDYTAIAAAPAGLYDQVSEDDEPLVRLAPFLAVYDDDAARDARTNDWTTVEGYQRDLIGLPEDPTVPGYITTFGTRIHFNRYTGVAMK